jgi:hypothetical protein
MKRQILIGMVAAGALAALGAWAQNQPQGPEAAGRGQRMMGTITAVGVNQFTIKKRDGTSQVILVNGQTQISEGRRQNRKAIQLEDLKTGDGVFVMGQPDASQQFVASVVHRIPAAMMEWLESNHGGRAFGQIESIEGNQIKVRNRQGEQTITVTDQTAFAKDGQPISLKDLKIGDRIFAIGDESNGQFTATRVVTGQFRGRGYGRPGRGQGGPAQSPPQNNP